MLKFSLQYKIYKHNGTCDMLIRKDTNNFIFLILSTNLQN